VATIFLIVYFTVNAIQLSSFSIANDTATFTFSQYATI
jgi:hypothetical protein